MADIKSPANPLFLREDELRQGIEMLFFAYRDFTAKADQTLGQFGFGRAHHRVIYFVGRNPGMTVSDLLAILHITKQSLSRVLGQLVRQGFILQKPGATDRRQRLLSLTDKGDTFNYDLTEALEVGYLLDLADVTVKSARARTESRGAHARDDFPNRDDGEWMKHTLATLNDDGSITLDYKPVIGGRYEPMERKY